MMRERFGGLDMLTSLAMQRSYVPMTEHVHCPQCGLIGARSAERVVRCPNCDVDEVPVRSSEGER